MVEYQMSFKDFAAKEFTFTHGAPVAGKPGDKPKDVPAAAKPAIQPEKAAAPKP